jgi:uncharacterized protein (DUF433 family)
MKVSAADNFISAFSEEQAGRLTGLSKAQLRYWDRTGFFTPSYADENRRAAYSRVYSFRDLLALRTLSALRNQYSVPLQHLRQASDELNRLPSASWASTTIYVLNKRVIFHENGTEKPREIVSGQFVVPIVLEKVMTSTGRAVEDLRKRPASSIGRVHKSRSINHNTPVVDGTRIPTAAIRRFREAGYSDDQIIEEYPDLTREDVTAALSFEGCAAA